MSIKPTNLQVLSTSDFSNPNTLAKIPDELVNLFDMSDNTDDNEKRMLEVMKVKTKSVAGGYFRKLKLLNADLSKERRSNKAKQRTKSPISQSTI